MIQLAINPRTIKIALAGQGELAARRLKILRAAGAERLQVYAKSPSDALRMEAPSPSLLSEDWPDDVALRGLNVLWIVGLPEAVAAPLAARARAAKVLVNVEDQPELCDFHSVAELRRGDLVMTVSTNGAAPGLAATIRRRLEQAFGPEWAGRVDEVKALRRQWREGGVSMAEAARRIELMAAERCWFSPAAPL